MLASLCLALLPLAPLEDIEWATSYDDALATARAEGKVVFVALDMDGLPACERMLDDVYGDSAIAKLAQRTVNLLGSDGEHRKKGRCPRVAGLTCEEHRRVAASLRDGVLKPGRDDGLLAPQVVFLGPDGAVLLSVPGELSADALEWCFVTALRAVDPDAGVAFSARARAPRRLLTGAVHDGWADKVPPPALEDEAIELARELKKGMRGEARENALKRLATSDVPDALDAVTTGLRGGGGGGKGGGAGRGRRDDRGQLLHWIGNASPPTYWEAVAEFIEGGDPRLQREAIVALEQLGAPESVKVLLARLKREKEPVLLKNILRALGAVGRTHKTARKELLKRAADDRDPLLQANALIALGFLTPHPDVSAGLRAALAGADERMRLAAVLAMGCTRDAAFEPLLKAALEDDPSNRMRAAASASLRVLAGAHLAQLEALVIEVAEDKIRRDKLFDEPIARDEEEGEDEDGRR